MSYHQIAFTTWRVLFLTLLAVLYHLLPRVPVRPTSTQPAEIMRLMQLFRSADSLHMLPMLLGGKDCRPRTPPNGVPGAVGSSQKEFHLHYLPQATYDHDIPGQNWETLTEGEAAEGVKLHVT